MSRLFARLSVWLFGYARVGRLVCLMCGLCMCYGFVCVCLCVCLCVCVCLCACLLVRMSVGLSV